MKYYTGLKICGYVTFYIIRDCFEDVVMVEEENCDGFIQALEFLGFEFGYPKTN